MTKAVATTGIAESFHEEDTNQRVLHSKIGCVLALVLMPAGVSLDLFVYPEWWQPLLASRLVCDVAVLVILALLFTKFGRRYIWFLGIAWALLPAAAISWMIYYLEGAHSPYYAGLNLVIIAVSLLMPWTLKEVLATCSITMVFYIAAVAGHHLWLDTPLPVDSFFNNVYFIFTTAAITSTASFFLSRMRFRDYKLRYELGQRNTELADSYEKLAELDRIKSQFFANVSHELRTPLTLIIAPLDDVLKSGGTGRGHLDQALKIARDNGLRLLRLINDLLDTVRMDERGADLKPQPENLTTLVPGVIHSAAHLAKTKGLSLSLDVPEREIIAEVDTHALEKVLLNLLTNAVKFTPSGGNIDVVLKAAGESAVIEVKDTGIGIAPGDLPKIFDRFGQLDASATRQYSGVGLGLALSRDLVEAHGGRLDAHSELSKGTTMRVSLPVSGTPRAGRASKKIESDGLTEVYRAANQSLTVDTESEDAELPAVGEGDHKVLVVEDEPDMRRFLVSFLSRDFRVLQAANGLKGLELARREKPALALLDLMLPGMDGLDLCGRLREEPGLESLKIVLLTARTDEDSKLEALERGANDFLTKPFSSMEVRTRLSNLLRGAELEGRLRSTNAELKDTIRTLKETEAQLIQSEKINALGTLSAGLLHEINNPLNFTLTAVQIALGEAQDDELKDTLNDIEDGMKRIRDIVSDLRSFAYPEKADNHDYFEVGKAVEVALRLAAHEMKDCKVTTEIQPGLRARGSQNQIVQVLINLLTNAAKATRDRQAQEIHLTGCDNNGKVRVTVRDNGVGIPEDARKHVFDPFYTTGQPGEGMGLGLSICHTIIKSHGGDIRVDSRPGHWTEVSFDLPSVRKES